MPTRRRLRSKLPETVTPWTKMTRLTSTTATSGRSWRSAAMAEDRIVATSLPLSHSMRLALQWMMEAAAGYRDPHGIVANTMDAPYLADGQVFMSVSTGRALE